MSTEMMRRAFLQTGVPTVSRRNSRFLTVALMLWIGSGALGQAEAGSVLATPAGLNGQTVHWLAIVSVEFTNAIDHIGQSTSPIYLANGTQVTTSTTASGLWSGALESPIFTDLNGQLVHGQIWTGTNADGVTVPGQALGDASAVVGSNRQISAGWIEAGVDAFISSHSLYGISQVLTVSLTQQTVPEPSSIVMLGMALLVAAYIRRFRNAKLCVRVIHIDAAFESSCVPNGYA
jgi:hypothetical protein